MRELITSEIDRLKTKTGSDEFDRDGIRELLMRLHNNVVPSERTVDLFFSSSNTKIHANIVPGIIFDKVIVPDVLIKPSPIFPKEQTEIQGFCIPNLSTVRYDDIDFVDELSGQLRKSYKAFIGTSVHVRYCHVNNAAFTMYEKATRENVKKELALSEIRSITKGEEDKYGFPFTLHNDEKDMTFYCTDDVTRTNWMSVVSTFCLLDMVSKNTEYDSERLRGLIQSGAKENASYGRQKPFPILLYLVLYKHMEDAKWLIQQNAKTACLLRWEFIVDKQGITPAELYNLLVETRSNLLVNSDDSLKFNLLHYVCYFGDVVTFNIIEQQRDLFTNLSLSQNYYNDSALTIALLSPHTSPDCKTKFASCLHMCSNLTICNKSNQNPIQLVLLMGKIGLLFQMLPLASNIQSDRYSNSILHLAIKAGLPTVARYILRFTTFPSHIGVDNEKDTVLTLAVKANEEDLASEILQINSDITHRPNKWTFPNSEKDTLFHQALKRNMQDLCCKLCEYGDFLSRDTNGDYPLHIALNQQLDRVIETLIMCPQALTFINECNESERDTPLHLSLKLGYYNHSRLLIEHGANINAVNRYGFTPVHILVMVAMNQFHSQAKLKMTPDEISSLMQLMLSKNPDLDIVSNRTSTGGNETCLHVAIRGGAATEGLALSILKYDERLVNSRDCNDYTPLALAVKNRNRHLVCALCDAKSELNVMNSDKDTPIHIAVNNRDHEIARELISRGAYPRIWNADGLCPIHLAIQQKDVKMLQILCNSDTDANLRTRDGYTPYMLTCLNGAFDCGAYIITQGGDPYMLSNHMQSCLSILANAIRQSPSPLEYAFSAQKLLEFADQYRLDFFGDKLSVDSDIKTLNDLVDNAKAQNMQMPDLSEIENYMSPDNTQEMMNESAGYVSGNGTPYSETAGYAAANATPYSETVGYAPSNATPYSETPGYAAANATPYSESVGYAPSNATPYSEPTAYPLNTNTLTYPGSVHEGASISFHQPEAIPNTMEERRAELYAQKESYKSQIDDKDQELENLKQQELNRIRECKTQVTMVVQENIKSLWKDQYQQAINMLINDNNRSLEEAQNDAFNFFVGRLSANQEEIIKAEMSKLKEAVTRTIDELNEKLNEVERELNSLG